MVAGRVYWAVLSKSGSKDASVIAKGVIEEPMAALYHSPTTHLMEAAYEAYRVLGE